jgi:hypothetical protein
MATFFHVPPSSIASILASHFQAYVAGFPDTLEALDQFVESFPIRCWYDADHQILDRE